MSLKPYSVYKRTIKGHDYTIMVFAAREGLYLLSQLAFYLSNVLRVLPGVDFKTFSFKSLVDGEIDEALIDNVVDALQSAFADSDKVIDLILKLIRKCVRDQDELSDEIVFDSVFAENYDELFLLLKEVITINFLSRNSMKESLKKQLATQMEKPTKAPKNG
jgi:hypothetical protein